MEYYSLLALALAEQDWLAAGKPKSRTVHIAGNNGETGKLEWFGSPSTVCFRFDDPEEWWLDLTGTVSPEWRVTSRVERV